MYVPIGQPNVFALNMYTLTLSDHPPTLRPSRHLVFAYFFQVVDFRNREIGQFRPGSGFLFGVNG